MAAPSIRATKWAGGACSCTALRKATRRVSLLYDAAIAPAGIKTTQRAILAHIGHVEPATVGKLAEALIMDAGGLAHTLKPLEREGLVEIAIDPNDRRNRLIRLTLRGRGKLAETDALWRQAQDGFESAFDASDAEILKKALNLLISDTFIERFEQFMGQKGDFQRVSPAGSVGSTAKHKSRAKA